MREEIIGDARLILGDCREILPTLGKVDAVVTSPPYNTLPTSTKSSGLHAKRKTGKNVWIEKAANGYADSLPEDEYQSWLIKILNQCFDICKGLVWVNHKIRYRDGQAIHPVRMFPFPIYAEVIWDRGNSMALNCRRFAPSHEGFWAFGSPHYWNDKNNTLMSVWSIPHAQRDAFNDHPCPYPENLIRPIIESSCPVGGIVCDPFNGSGTTGVVAVKNGFSYVGIERDVRWFDVSCRRIEAAYKQPDMFVSRPEPPKQDAFL